MKPERQNKKPAPLLTATLRAKCPVCGTTSYSRGGVHPQCEAKRLAKLGRLSPQLAKS
jgi:hypothetical protein